MSKTIKNIVKVYLIGQNESIIPDIINFKEEFVEYNGITYSFDKVIFFKCSFLPDRNGTLIYEKDTISLRGLQGLVVFELGKFMVELTDTTFSSVYYNLADVFWDCTILNK